MAHLDDALLADFAASFYGYGDYSAPYWFVGMEEGGGDSVEEVARRLWVWNERGRRELEDLPSYSRHIGVGRFFDGTARLQPTWSKLIRLYLGAEGLRATTEAVRAYQRNGLGQAGGRTALLELLPLPSPSTSHWLYAEHSSLPHFADRAGYAARTAPPRADHLAGRIRRHRPRAVVFYGKSYRVWWEHVAGSTFIPDETLGVLYAERAGTTFVITPHPVAMGVSNALFYEVGRAVLAGSTARGR